MRKFFPICGLFFAATFPTLRAGSVNTLADAPEADGKLSLKGDAVHVDSSSPADVSLATVLQANFGDSFQLNYFDSATAAGGQLPTGWKAQDEGTSKVPGLVSYANGTFTLSGSGMELKKKEESTNSLFAGLPWTGDGEWTVRVAAIDPVLPNADAGLMLRESLDSTAAETTLGATADANSRQFDGAGVRFLSSEYPVRPDVNPAVSIQLPVWLRLTRSGASLEGAISQDGKDWQVLYENLTKMGTASWVGLFISGHRDPHALAAAAPLPVPGGAAAGGPAPVAPPPGPPPDDPHLGETLGKATLDQVSLTPGPCSVQVVPPGVILESGSFLAGAFERVTFDPDTPAEGAFHRAGETEARRPTPIPTSKIAVVTLHPTERSRLAQGGAQAGLIMKNGDLLVGDTQAIDRGGVTANSLLLGIVPYHISDVLACIVRPIQAQTAPYEIRLTDGSDLLAVGVAAAKDQVVINEVSGLSVTVDQDQIAQFRAGATQVQDLVDLPWQVEAPPPAAGTPAPAAAANATTPLPGAPATPPTPAELNAAIQCWQGPSQEHILVLPAARPVDFPLTGKFRELAMSIALAPDAAPNLLAVVRIIADGREVLHTPPIRTGDAPRFVEVNVRDPKTVTIVADSQAGAKVLLVDPVALRDN